MGPAVPYAIAAKYAHPDRPVIALLGDGAMQMNGINALVTIAKVWHEWGDPRLTIMVLNNGDLNQVTWEQRVMQGDPKFPDSQDVPDFPYAEYAKLLGLRGLRVDDPEKVGDSVPIRGVSVGAYTVPTDRPESMALSAVDTALWDLKARCLGVSLAVLLGRARESIPVYGSGGFTSYDEDQLRRQLGGGAEQGLTIVKSPASSVPPRYARPSTFRSRATAPLPCTCR